MHLAEQRRSGDPEQASRLIDAALDVTLQRLELAEHPPRPLDIALPRVGELHPAGGALEQAHFEPALEP